MENISRRGFVGAAAAAAGMGMAGLGASLAQAEPQEVAPKIEAGSEDLDMYRMHTSLDTINELRREAIDKCEDYVCEDGTVIPAVWVKMRMLVDGLGAGIGARTYTADNSFALFQRLAYNDEDLAQFYINCPLGVKFTVLDAAVANDCTEKEAKEQLDRLAWTGAMFHVNVAGIDYYNHQRMYHGITESSINLYKPNNENDGFMVDFNASLGGRELTEFPCYYPLPPVAEVVVDNKILPYDDIEALLERHEVFAVSACQCRYIADRLGESIEELPDPTDLEAVKDWVCVDGHHLEKCFTLGEEAQFYIDQGIARQLTRDEARELIQRQAVDEGCMMQSNYSKYTEVICSCDKGCTNWSGYVGMPTDSKNYANQSHYDLMWDDELCIGCGMCVERCVPGAIEMVDGKPAVTGYCFRCGQCGIVCPVSARKLQLKDLDQIPELPDDLVDWSNKDTMWRYEKGLWPYDMAPRTEA